MSGVKNRRNKVASEKLIDTRSNQQWRKIFDAACANERSIIGFVLVRVAFDEALNRWQFRRGEILFNGLFEGNLDRAREIRDELGWQPRMNFTEGLSLTVDWYLANEAWLEHVTSGAYQQYYASHYAQR